MLCANSWEGGGGYTPGEVGDMTLDMASMRLAELKHLRDGTSERSVKMKMGEAAGLNKTDDGYVKGRDADGNPIKKKIGGKSWARQLMEQEQAKAEAEKRKKEKRRKRKMKKQNISEQERRRRIRNGLGIS